MHVTMVRYLEMQVTSGFFCLLVSYFEMQIVVTLYFGIVMFLLKNRLLVELCMFFIKRMKE
jgi:hypothetical protein